MQSEFPEGHTAGNDNMAAAAGGAAGANSLECDDNPPEAGQPADEQPGADSADGDESGLVKVALADSGKGQEENRVQQRLNETSAEVINGVSGNNNRFSSHVHYHADPPRDLAEFVTKNPLHSSRRSYKSLDISGRAGILLSHRILLLSCYSDDVALNVGKCIAYENTDASKLLVTIERNCEGAYTFKNLIQALARSKGDDGRRGSHGLHPPQPTICLWAAHNISEDNISNAILDSLFIGNAEIEQYQDQLNNHGLCLICLVSPQKLQDYKRSRLKVNLQNWEIDFLGPLLEEYELGQCEELAEIIARQRQQMKWSEDDAEFYGEVSNHLVAGKLPEVVARKEREERRDESDMRQLFDRQDPLLDTVLYCATYYPGLSPQDFSYLVQLFLGDATEEVSRKAALSQPQNGNEMASAVESVPLSRRWQRDSDAILERCHLAAVANENDKRMVDFQVDGLRSRLRHYIRNEHYFFYESRFDLTRELGLLFSPKKKIAEGARQLLLEMATQYAPEEVVSWLYEVIAEFERMAQATDLLRQRQRPFHLLPDASVKAARSQICHGLGLVLSRLYKEPNLQEAARLFWQRLLVTQHQWFLDLLRQMGNSAPTETPDWLKQLLDRGAKEIRRQALDYLLGYLLRRESLIYTTLEELMQWPSTTQAGAAMRTLLIVYCVQTNRQVPQRDYGQWPSSHPLFSFQTRTEACERINLLVGWLFTAAFEAYPEDALDVIADIIAGWYFILSSPSRPAIEEAASVDDDADALNARSVRRLLLERLAERCSRSERSSLLQIWESFKSKILEEIFQLEECANQVAEISLNARLMTDMATVRRKLLETRALLSQLRKDFINCAAEIGRG